MYLNRLFFRTYNLLNVYEKCRISHNWKIGRYAEKSYLYVNERFMPWLHLTKDHIWLSRGKWIKAYRRKKSSIDVRRPQFILSGVTDADVCKFAFRNNYVIAGQRYFYLQNNGIVFSCFVI